MFGKLFKRGGQAPEDGLADRQAALDAAIAAERQRNPMAGAQAAARVILDQAMVASRDVRGVHVETLFMTLGALAGFACQMSVRAEAGEHAPAFNVVTTAEGRTLYFGDALNAPLAERDYSVWSLVAGGIERAGGALPDLGDIFRHVSQSVGTPGFGLPRYPEGTGTPTRPEAMLKALWPELAPVVVRFCAAPAEWPIAFGIAIQQAIGMAAGAIAPSAAGAIAMEAAVAMSKIAPEEVGVAV